MSVSRRGSAPLSPPASLIIPGRALSANRGLLKARITLTYVYARVTHRSGEPRPNTESRVVSGVRGRTKARREQAKLKRLAREGAHDLMRVTRAIPRAGSRESDISAARYIREGCPMQRVAESPRVIVTPRAIIMRNRDVIRDNDDSRAMTRTSRRRNVGRRAYP